MWGVGYNPGWSGPFWDEQCADRGPTLTHMHASDCRQAHTDPAHGDNTCCHCGQIVRWRSMQDRLRARAVSEGNPTHEHKWNLSGYCDVCGGHVPSDQPSRSAKVMQDDTCVVDHQSLKAERSEPRCGCDDGTAHLRRLEGRFVMKPHAAHEVWKVCPECGEMLELAHATGEVTGPIYGPGRGVITERQKRRLEFVKYLSPEGKLGGG